MTTVYVYQPNGLNGPAEINYMFSCDLESLHAMAVRMGIPHSRFQRDPAFPHYKIGKPKTLLAMKAGVVRIGRHQFIDLVKAFQAQNWKGPAH